MQLSYPAAKKQLSLLLASLGLANNETQEDEKGELDMKNWITDPKSTKASEIIKTKLKAAGVRVKLDNRGEKIGYKIREAQLQKVPYMLVIGENEVQDGTVVTVRKRDGGDQGTVKLDDFIADIQKEIADRV